MTIWHKCPFTILQRDRNFPVRSFFTTFALWQCGSFEVNLHKPKSLVFNCHVFCASYFVD